MTKYIVLFFVIFFHYAHAIEITDERVGPATHIKMVIPYSDFTFQKHISTGYIIVKVRNEQGDEIYRKREKYEIIKNPMLKLKHQFYFDIFYILTNRGVYFADIYIFDKFGKKRHHFTHGFYISRKEYKRQHITKYGTPFLVNNTSKYSYFTMYDFQLPKTDSQTLFLPINNVKKVELIFWKDGVEVSENIDIIDANLIQYRLHNDVKKIKLLVDQKKINIPKLTKINEFRAKYSLEDQRRQLFYVATQSEAKYFSDIPFERLKEEIDLFWKLKDPTPGNRENENLEIFMQRVLIADLLYSMRNYKQGWQTDRGKVYIIYGEPDEIEEEVHPFDSYPYIIWRYYNLAKTFVFYDKKGFGQYELHENWKGLDSYFD